MKKWLISSLFTLPFLGLVICAALNMYAISTCYQYSGDVLTDSAGLKQLEQTVEEHDHPYHFFSGSISNIVPYDDDQWGAHYYFISEEYLPDLHPQEPSAWDLWGMLFPIAMILGLIVVVIKATRNAWK